MSLPPHSHTTRHPLPRLSAITWEALVALIFAAAAVFFWVQNYGHDPAPTPTASVETQPDAEVSTRAASPRFE